MTRRALRTFFLLVLLSLPSAYARADDMCDYYQKNYPGIYKILCNGGIRQTKGSRSNSTLSDSMRTNPASLPTQPTSYGLENIGSLMRKPPGQFGYDFSLLKGYQKIGAGFSTSSNYTFYGNDVMSRAQSRVKYLDTFKAREKATGYVTNLNLSTAIALNAPKSKKSHDVIYTLGLTGRYNHISNKLGGGTGISASNGTFTFGGSIVQETISNNLPPIYFITGILGYRISFIEFEYNFLKNIRGYQLEPIHIATVSFSLGRLILTGAVRRLNYIVAGNAIQPHGAAQLLITKNFSAGFLYNYVPGCNSLAIQIYF